MFKLILVAPATNAISEFLGIKHIRGSRSEVFHKNGVLKGSLMQI